MNCIQSHPGPNVEACNAQGQSIQTLAAAAMDVASDVSSDEAPTAARPSSKRVCPSPASDGAGQHWRTAADDLDAESEWQARLREESGAELRGGDEEDWDRYGCVQALLMACTCMAMHGVSILAGKHSCLFNC